MDIRGEVPARGFYKYPTLFFDSKHFYLASSSTDGRRTTRYSQDYCLANVSLLRLTLDPTLMNVITLSASEGWLPLHSVTFYSAIWSVFREAEADCR